MTQRLYLVTRQDLPPGPQAVQAAHAMREFAAHPPYLDRSWYKESNTLAFLAVADEAALGVLLAQAQTKGIASSPFREPDRGNELTALCLGPAARKLCSRLPLALRPGPVPLAQVVEQRP